mgnify:CR=1 FL=1
MDMDIYKDVFREINHEWAVITAGTLNDFGCMTIAWASIGALWVKTIVTLYVKPIRNTHDYLLKNDYFTLSAFSREYKDDLVTISSISDRNDSHKIEKTRLKPIGLGENAVTFLQAKKAIVCKKIYQQRLDVTAVPEDIKIKYYKNEEIHTMFIGEIENIMYFDNVL